MSAHFLLSPACRTLTLAQVAGMSEDQAWQAFCKIRWAATQGHPVCPRCTCHAHYDRPARRAWICKKCGSEFSVTAGTILADRKMSFRHLLLAIYLFVCQSTCQRAVIACGKMVSTTCTTLASVCTKSSPRPTTADTICHQVRRTCCSVATGEPFHNKRPVLSTLMWLRSSQVILRTGWLQGIGI